MAKLEPLPWDIADSNMNWRPFSSAAVAVRTRLVTIAFARTIVAGRPPSFCGTPIGCLLVRSTCDAPDLNRAADQVEQGGDATIATQRSGFARVAT
eukprot:4166827-Pleurochrysis_carterae.AAC.2